MARKPSTCGHCAGELVAHEGGEKDGALHCNGCGCCFVEDGETLRPGHPACKIAADAEAAAAAPVEAAAEESPAVEEAADDSPAATKDTEPGNVAPEDTSTPERRVGRR